MKLRYLRRRSVWLPFILFIYFGIFAVVNAKDWINSGRTWLFIAICTVELIFIVGAFFTLRRKEKLAEKRKL